MSGPAGLIVSGCPSCHGRFLPRPGACPRCGSVEVESVEIPAIGEVLAATELAHPAPGWAAPHRLVLVEAAEGVRLLAVVEGPLPAVGARVTVARQGDHFLVLADPTRPA